MTTRACSARAGQVVDVSTAFMAATGRPMPAAVAAFSGREPSRSARELQVLVDGLYEKRLIARSRPEIAVSTWSA
jgi:hypothetical protein